MQALPDPKSLLQKAKDLGHSAIAITDMANLIATWDAHKEAKKIGIKYIAGCEFYFVDDLQKPEERLRTLILLAKNHTGYKNLLLLHKLANDNLLIGSRKNYPRIDWKILEQHTEGLICLTGDCSGILGQPICTRRTEEAKIIAKRLQDLFKLNLGLEVQPSTQTRTENIYSVAQDQRFVNTQVIKIAKELNIKIVPTTGCRYLEKEDWEAHDVACAIGAGQQVKSGNRPKYSNDFYFKTEEEVRSYFARLYPKDIDEWMSNTVFFADQCEDPVWIDPKFTNPSGKELPEFPVKDQPDYSEFLKWKENPVYPCATEEETKVIRELKDDAAYYRYLVYNNFEKKTPKGKEKEYHDRLVDEFDVIEYRDFSSYMLIVKDFIDWCKAKNIPVGYGRGCLKGETLVLTENGYKQLKDIQIGDKVYSHTGKLQNVSNKYEFDIQEKCLGIKSTFQIVNQNLTMTKDHKVLAIRNKNYRSEEKEWIEAKDLKIKDYIVNPLPIREIKNPEKIDISKYISEVNRYKIENDKIVIYDHYPSGPLSNTNLSKKLKLDQGTLRKFKNCKKINPITRERIIEELNFNNISVEDWRDNKFASKEINRFIEIDEEFLYHLGRWVGDGAYHTNGGINIAFNIKDQDSIKRTKEYFEKLGCTTWLSVREKLNCTCVLVYDKFISNIYKTLISRYESSINKHLPDFFRQLDCNLLRSLIMGLTDSDGCVTRGSEAIVTISKELAFQTKEALYYLGVPASICGQIPIKTAKGALGKQYSYHINFVGLHVQPHPTKNLLMVGGGHKSRITKIEEIDCEKVYDITVDEDHSYITPNGAVHNSVGGALDAYYADIHQIDSIKYDLVFARFQNKEKKSFPDVDSDFSQAGKPLVEKYIRNKYGEEKVAKISNYMTLSPKQYVKSMSRAFQFGTDIKDSIAIGQRLADLIPIDTSGKNFNDVDECIRKIPILAEYCLKYPQIEKFAKLLQNKPTALAKHAAGIVIGKRPLVDIVPLRRDEEGDLILEFEKERAEESGLVKLDLLGLSTLDIIKLTHEIIKKRGKEVPQIDFEKYDEKTYDMISKGNTMCVFQFGTSGGTIDLCRKIKPKTVEDLSVITTLARPSAKKIREPFLLARSGKKKFKPFHKCLDRAFEKTLGFPLYEESLLILVQDAAKWDLHKADGLRKMTKDKGKHPEKEKELKENFLKDAQKDGGLSETIANKVWTDVIQNYSEYGFVHSHAALYSMTSYVTAYLKAHYPLEFLTANLIFESNSNSPQAEDNKLKIKDEIRALGVKIIPPDINRSESTYTIIDDHTLMAGLDSLKYMGKDAMPEITGKRPFNSFDDFLSKIEPKLVRSPAVSALAASGALDSFGLSRKQMFLYASDYKKKIQIWKKKINPGEFQYPWPNDIGDWSIREKFAMEKSYIGEGLSGNFGQIYPGFFDKNWVNFSKLKEYFPADKAKGESYVDSTIGNLQGVIKSIFEFTVKKEGSKLKGQTMAKLTIEDLEGNVIGLTLFPDKLTEVKETMKAIYGTKIKLEPWVAIHFNGFANWYEGDICLTLDGIKKCAPPPQKPDDLKSRTVKMKISLTKKEKMQQTSFDFEEKVDDETKEMIDEMEEHCFEEGVPFDEEVEYES